MYVMDTAACLLLNTYNIRCVTESSYLWDKHLDKDRDGKAVTNIEYA